MKLPLIVDEHGDISVYDTVEDLEMDLEPIDIRNNEFLVYDQEGSRIQLKIDTIKRKVLWGFLGTIDVEKVVVDTDSSQHGYEGELRSRLIDFLTRAGIAMKHNASASLQELIDAARNKPG